MSDINLLPIAECSVDRKSLLQTVRMLREVCENSKSKLALCRLEKTLLNESKKNVPQLDLSKLCLEVLALFKNMKEEQPKRINYYIKSGIIKIIIELLKSGDYDVCEAAIEQVGYVMCYSETYFDYCMENGVIQSLISLIDNEMCPFIQIVACLLHIICILVKRLSEDLVLLLINGLKKLLLVSKDLLIIGDAICSVEQLILKDTNILAKIIDCEIVPIVLRYLLHYNPLIKHHAMRCLEDILFTEIRQVGYLIDKNLLSYLPNLLMQGPDFANSVLFWIGIMAGIDDFIVRKILQNGILPIIFDIIRNNSDQTTQYRAVIVLSIIVRSSYPETLDFLVQAGVVEVLCSLFTFPPRNVLSFGVHGLKYIVDTYRFMGVEGEVYQRIINSNIESFEVLNEYLRS